MSTATTTTSTTTGEGRPDSPARRRLLDTASRLFYAEGIHAVGVDRIIAEAGVAKATFYKHFPSKDQLVLAYVEEQDRLGREEATADVAGKPAREALLAFFESYAGATREPGYRGCPFINAAAEYADPASPVRKAIDDHRRWLRGLFRDLLADDGNPDPGSTADILMLITDGLLVAGELDDPARLRTVAREAVLRTVAPSS
jgi:AcrR family transcriptional regulator